MYLTILTIKQVQHENLVQSIKTITKFTKCPLYIFVVIEIHNNGISQQSNSFLFLIEETKTQSIIRNECAKKNNW